MKEDIREIEKEISKINFFKYFNEAQIKEICMICNIEYYKRGEIIFREGDAGDSVFIILSGRLEVFRKEKGSRVSLAVLSKGDILGELEVLHPSGEGRSASCSALEDTSAVRIKSEDILNAIEQGSQAGVKMLFTFTKVIIDRLRKMDEEFTKLFLECKGKHKYSELRSIKEKILKEWNI